MPDPDPSEIIDATPPTAYLTQPPSPGDEALARSVGLYSESEVPFWMLAKLADRLHMVAVWVSSADRVRRWVRRMLVAGTGVALLQLVALGRYELQQATADGAAEERAAGLARDVERYRAATDERLSDLRGQIQELRAAMYRKSGIDPLPLPHPPNGSIPRPGIDKLTLNMTAGTQCSILDAAQALFAPPPPFPIPDSCGAGCSSGLECSQHDILRACPFCNFGTCRSTRPDALKGPR